jgi:hypothetical protein
MQSVSGALKNVNRFILSLPPDDAKAFIMVYLRCDMNPDIFLEKFTGYLLSRPVRSGGYSYISLHGFTNYLVM